VPAACMGAQVWQPRVTVRWRGLCHGIQEQYKTLFKQLVPKILGKERDNCSFTKSAANRMRKYIEQRVAKMK